MYYSFLCHAPGSPPGVSRLIRLRGHRPHLAITANGQIKLPRVQSGAYAVIVPADG
ncbi:MAG: hypothetical protein LC099_06585 [Anaerolineales bacterium]|nr:hypothetical protein [Anaerolineales bacterium]